MTQSRLDVRALYLTLDSERDERGLSWRRLAHEAGVGASTLSRMAQGSRPDVDSFVALVQWLGMPAERFMRGSAEDSEATATTPAQAVASLLRANRNLDPDSVAAIDDILKAAMRLADRRVKD
jgi:transcriptional regulator with XRE-family HTH domain